MNATCLNLFVYGSLRAGFQNHRFIEQAKAARVGETFTTRPLFTMRDLGSFPGVEKGGETSIVGEVYKLEREADFLPFDRLEGHPNFYCREVVMLDDGTKAWIYLLADKRVSSSSHYPVIPCGDWAQHTESRG